LTSSLPILAGVLVNPLAGALVWVANEVVVNPSIGSITAVNYKIQGDFDNPEITKVVTPVKQDKNAKK